MLALASGARAQTINASTPANIATAITDANTGGSPIVLTTSAVNLTGVTMPTLTTGALQFGEVNGSGVGQIGQVSGGEIVDDANVTFATPTGDTNTVSTEFSGTGSLTVTGPGVLTLVAGNTYTGATTISSGATLMLDSSGSIPNSSVTVNGTLDVAETVLSTPIIGGLYGTG
ncbi:MAG: hypothetical protein ABSD80_13955, partial [Caulobacteraceae bacterium]